MSREEAIKIIKECKEKGFKHTFYTLNEYYTALDMAIKALRCEDTFFDKVLEIIDTSQTYKMTAGEGDTYIDKRVLREAVEALREGIR